MAAAGLIAGTERSRSPYRDKWERNGEWMNFAVNAGRRGRVTPADTLAGLGARILAERDRLLWETVGLWAERAVQEIGSKAQRPQTEERPGRRIGLC